MEWTELARELNPTLRRGDLGACVAHATIALTTLPETPFHVAASVDFTNPPSEVAAYFRAFVQTLTFGPAALYAETNGFDINPESWYCDLFAYQSYGGTESYGWLADWQASTSEPLALMGMEQLQAVYASAAIREVRNSKASGLASLLVVLKFQSLISRAGRLLAPGYPVLATGHEYDLIYQYPQAA